MPQDYPTPRYQLQVDWGGSRLSFTEVTGLVMEREKTRPSLIDCQARHYRSPARSSRWPSPSWAGPFPNGILNPPTRQLPVA